MVSLESWRAGAYDEPTSHQWFFDLEYGARRIYPKKREYSIQRKFE